MSQNKSTRHRTSGSAARDDYLEQIHHLIEENGYARPIDISKKLEISQASVTNMLKKLNEEGLVKHIKYRGTTLTDQGQSIARAIIDRHRTLTTFLELFDIDKDTIYRDVEGMEHHVSRASLEAIRAVAAHLTENPATLSAIKDNSAL